MEPVSVAGQNTILASYLEKSGEEMIKDHKGNEFPTKGAMYKHWKTTHGRVSLRMNKGMTLGDALESPKVHPNKVGRMGRDASGWGRGNEILLGKSKKILT